MRAHDPAKSSTAAPTGLRRLAVLVALVFGCTTVRHPASTIGGPVVVRDGHAEPQLELWLESGAPPTAEESAAASAAARAALERALEGRAAPDGDSVLVVRAQGVTRTGSYKRDQRAAKIGIAVGAVVIVVGAIIMVVASRGKGGGKGGRAPAAKPSAPRVAGGGVRGAAVGRGVRAAPPAGGPRVRAPAPGARGPSVRPAPPGGGRPVPSPRPGVRPRPPVHPGPWYPYDPGPRFSWSIGFWLDLTPAWEPYPPYAREVAPGPWAPPPGPYADGADGADEEDWVYERAPDADADAYADEAPAEPPPEELAEVFLPPPEPLSVDHRSYFDGDVLRLELWMVDRRTGEPLWRKTVQDDVDPRDPAAVRKAVEKALQPGGWVEAS